MTITHWEWLFSLLETMIQYRTIICLVGMLIQPSWSSICRISEISMEMIRICAIRLKIWSIQMILPEMPPTKQPLLLSIIHKTLLRSMPLPLISILKIKTHLFKALLLIIISMSNRTTMCLKFLYWQSLLKVRKQFPLSMTPILILLINHIKIQLFIHNHRVNHILPMNILLFNLHHMNILLSNPLHIHLLNQLHSM